LAILQVDVSADGLRREVRCKGLARPIWFEFAEASPPPPLAHQDFALLTVLPMAMHLGIDLEADFSVDAALLDGIDHFQEVWHSWRPDIFRNRIKITPAEERNGDQQASRDSSAVCAYSAGVDSTFTLARHVSGEAGRSARRLQGAVMVHGFDMPLDAVDGFKSLYLQGRSITEHFGVPLYPVKTNWRQVVGNWEMTFAAGLASVLHQFSGTHGAGLIATEESYANSIPVWGNSFWTDRFFSSSSFRIESDGGAFDRIERVKYLARHPAVLPHLRVCWAGPRNGENCGVCPKCVLTKLNLVIAKVPEPWPFPQGLTYALVRDMPIITAWQAKFLGIILARLEDDTPIDQGLVDVVRERLSRIPNAVNLGGKPLRKRSPRSWLRSLTRS
jgi:hypothetical protein